jgi:hypothetical protein
MKAIVATRFGEPADVLELKTLRDPTPPGPGEVVVRVTKQQIQIGLATSAFRGGARGSREKCVK